MKFLIAHNRPEIGVFAGMVSPTRYAWTNNGDDAGGAVCYDSYARAVAAQDELRKAGFYRLRIVNCVADMRRLLQWLRRWVPRMVGSIRE